MSMVSRLPRDEIARRLLSENIILFGEFKIRNDEEKSPVYADFRIPELAKMGSGVQPELMASLVLELEALAKGINFSSVAGVPSAGDAFAKELSPLVEKPLVLLGKDGRVLGDKPSLGTELLLVENATTTGKSIINLVRKLQDQGMLISDVLILLDRGQGAIKRLRSCDIEPHVLFNLGDLLDLYLKERMILKEQYDEVATYLAKYRR